MTLPREKRQARIMMHVNAVIGAICFILFVMAVTMKIWILAVGIALCGVAQYFSYKHWQKRA